MQLASFRIIRGPMFILIIIKVKINITNRSIVDKSPTYCIEISLFEFKIDVCFMIFRHRIVVCFWSEKAARQVIISVISSFNVSPNWK